jgi:hypothetical protein
MTSTSSVEDVLVACVDELTGFPRGHRGRLPIGADLHRPPDPRARRAGPRARLPRGRLRRRRGGAEGLRSGLATTLAVEVLDAVADRDSGARGGAAQAARQIHLPARTLRRRLLGIRGRLTRHYRTPSRAVSRRLSRPMRAQAWVGLRIWQRRAGNLPRFEEAMCPGRETLDAPFLATEEIHGAAARVAGLVRAVRRR